MQAELKGNMPTTYTTCGTDLDALLNRTIAKSHPDLMECGATFCLLFAKSSTEAPAISMHGYQTIAKVKKIGLKDRVAGLPDVMILIDEVYWQESQERRRAAIIDHCLFSLRVLRDKWNAIKEDDSGRPKMGIRKHDWHGGGFYEIARRHGLDAVEVRAIRSVLEKFQQMHLEFVD